MREVALRRAGGRGLTNAPVGRSRGVLHADLDTRAAGEAAEPHVVLQARAAAARGIETPDAFAGRALKAAHACGESAGRHVVLAVEIAGARDTCAMFERLGDGRDRTVTRFGASASAN